MGYKRDFNTENEDNPQSRINAAGLINSTLEKLWNEGYTAMSNGEYIKWNTKLDCIWAILGGDVKENDAEDKKMQKINLKIYDLGSLSTKSESGFQKKENPNKALQYQWLLSKCVFLRRLQNKQGKGTAYQNLDMDDFD
ncbi:MAG TPA: hypothetical protein VMZ91_12070 [Candidatus Paceibacterota bacterium]|nr:hypothetical protein [Candidatus Paceibacterota bacterium]